MRILYVAARLPFPPNRGDRISTFNHIRYLSKRHSVSVAALIQSQDERENVGKLKDWAETVDVEYQAAWRKGLGMLWAFLTGKPLSVGHFSNPALMRKVRRLVRDRKIEAVVVHSSCVGHYVQAFPELIRIMYFADMDSQKWTDMAVKASGLKRWIYTRESRTILEQERIMAATFSASCVVTDSEALLFKELIPDRDVFVVANGVDFEKFGAVVRKPEACELTFVGMMNYEPNIEAVVFFVKRIWPLIRARHPEARFNIVGGQPSREVKALAETAGVHVTGFVDDVRDYLATSSLVVVPLDIARGLQNKLLEAMAAGVPLLSTPTSAKGLPEAAQATLYVEERDPEAYAQAIFRILADGPGSRAKAVAARAYVKDHYSWESKVDFLEGLILGGGKPRAGLMAEGPLAVPFGVPPSGPKPG